MNKTVFVCHNLPAPDLEDSKEGRMLPMLLLVSFMVSCLSLIICLLPNNITYPFIGVYQTLRQVF